MPSLWRTTFKKAEEALKDSVKYTTDTVKPIIATGKERTRSRKISDMLLFFAAALLIIVPFISFIKLPDLVWNFYLNVGSLSVAMPSGLIWSEIRLLSSFADLVAYGTAGSALLTIFITPYFIVLSIVSFVALIKSIVKFCKGESYDITNLTRKALSRVLTFFVFVSLFSTNGFNVRISPLMLVSLIFAMALIIAAAVYSLIASKKSLFANPKEGYGAISMIAYFAFALLSVLFIMSFRAFDYISIFISAVQANTDDLSILLGSIFAFPTLIFGLLLLFNYVKNVKSSFRSAVYLNYASREEKIYYKRACLNHTNSVSMMVIATIHLVFSFMLAFTFFLGNIETITSILESFGKIAFADFISYLLKAAVSPFSKFLYPSLIIWVISVIGVVAKCICSSLAKKQASAPKKDIATEELATEDTKPEEISNTAE